MAAKRALEESRRRTAAAYAESRAGLDKLDHHELARLREWFDAETGHVTTLLRREFKGRLKEKFLPQYLIPLRGRLQAHFEGVGRRLEGKLRESTGEVLEGGAREAGKLVGKLDGRTMPPGLAESVRTKHEAELQRLRADSARGLGRELGHETWHKLRASFEAQTRASDLVALSGELLDAQSWRVERLVRTECLPGDARIEGAIARAISRRWYDGPMFTVRTNGREFSGTPNHPVLTQRGWVGLSGVLPGDNLVCHTRQENPRSSADPNIDDRPPTLAELFYSAQAVGVSERRGGAEPDFHGDGREGDVDIQWANGVLHVGSFAPLTQPLSQRIFPPAALSALSFCASCRALQAVNEGRRGRNATCCNACLLEAEVNDAAVYVVRFGQTQGTLPGVIAAADLLSRHAQEQARVHPSTRHEDKASLRQRARLAGSLDYTAHPPQRVPEALGDLLQTQAGFVELDRVVSCTSRQFSGHVFNLHTRDGYYVSNLVYTKNCSYGYNLAQAAALQAIPSEPGELIWGRWTERIDDASGIPLDKRVAQDSFVLHGQVARPGGTFTMPADPRAPTRMVGQSWAHPPNRPNDRSVYVPWRRAWGVPGWVYQGGRRIEL